MAPTPQTRTAPGNAPAATHVDDASGATVVYLGTEEAGADDGVEVIEHALVRLTAEELIADVSG